MSDYRTCRIDADIVIIDSGLDKTLQLNENIIGGVRICVDDEENAVISENFDDLFGHGTAIYSIINNNCDAKYYIIKIFDDSQNCNQKLLLLVLKYIYANITCKLILICSGSIVFNNLEEITDITEKLYKEKKVIIVSAYNNEGAISYPAAGDYVIGVDSSRSVSYRDEYYVLVGSPVNIVCHQRSFRVVWLNGRKIMQKGNSYSAAYCASLIFNAYMYTDSCDIEYLLQYIKKDSNILFYNHPDFGKLINPFFLSIKRKMRAIAFPFSKEVKALASNEDQLVVEMIGYYDIRESGRVGLKISDVLRYSDNDKVIRNIDELDIYDDYDLLICGHLSRLSDITMCDWRKKIEKIVIEKNKYVYMFDSNALTENERVFFPPLINNYRGYTLGKMWHIFSPVLGVFGTSSAQGKFSLQLKLRKAFINAGYYVKQISTEPTGALFGMDYMCPFGYNSSISINRNEAAKYYNQLLHECDVANPDLIIVGSQSATVPQNNYNESFFTFEQIEFLFGTRPDAVVLVINHFDEIQYINRTIRFIESSVDTKVICCVLSPANENLKLVDIDYRKRIADAVNVPVFDYREQFNCIYDAIINYF